MPGPINSVIDAFTRGDESPIGAPWRVWYPGAPMPILSGNRMGFSGGGGWAAYDDVVSADQEVFYTITAHVTSRHFMLGVRFTGLNSSSLSGYWFEPSTTDGSGQIRRMDNTSSTALGSSFTQPNAVGDSYRLWASADTIGVDYKAAAGSWIELATRTDDTYGDDGYVVVGADDALLSLDDFGYGALAVVPSLKLRDSGVWVPASVRLRSGGVWVPASTRFRSGGVWI